MSYRDVPAYYLGTSINRTTESHGEFPPCTRFSMAVAADPTDTATLLALRNYFDRVLNAATAGATALLWREPPVVYVTDAGFTATASLSRVDAWGPVPGDYDYTVFPPVPLTPAELTERLGA